MMMIPKANQAWANIPISILHLAPIVSIPEETQNQ